MIDLHSHILPGLDDGARDTAATLSMARVAVADGIETVVATPHVNFRYEYDFGEIERLVEETNGLFADHGLPLEVLAGAELDVSRLAEIEDSDLRRLCLGSGTSLLVESPYSPVAGPLDEVVYELQLKGYTPVLAHPERSPVFRSDRDRLRRLVERGALCSITAGSISGAFGATVRNTALALLADDLVHNVSSDAHDAARRPPVIGNAVQEAVRRHGGSGSLERWLALETPRALLSGDPIPPRPDSTRRRGRRWRRLLS